MKSLKLNQIENNRLSEKEMFHIVGGKLCGCGCAYADSGGSSQIDNGHANYDGGKFSTEMGKEYLIVKDK